MKTWRIGRVEIEVELAFGWRVRWRMTRDEGLAIVWSFLLGCVYVTIYHPRLPSKGWEQSRELSWGIYDWVVSWKMWADPNCWHSTTPKWRDGSWDIRDAVLGRPKFIDEPIETRDVLVPMPESNYRATAILSWGRSVRARWFTKKWKRVEIRMVSGQQIPIPGKGENSWDCGEDAIYSRTQRADSIEDAIGQLVGDCLMTRRRRGGRDWVPEKLRQPA